MIEEMAWRIAIGIEFRASTISVGSGAGQDSFSQMRAVWVCYAKLSMGMTAMTSVCCNNLFHKGLWFLCPVLVSRYFCRRVFGLSGTVISIKPIANSGSM